MKDFIERIKKGNIYCVGARSFVDKSQFCIDIASKFVSKGNKVLYMSHEMEDDVFTTKQQATNINVADNIEFLEMFKITIEGLEMFVDDDNYDLIVLDPFDIYSLDIDVGDLKEFAERKNVAILLTTNLARPLLQSRRKHPVLSDIKILDKKVKRKLIAFSNTILFLTQDAETNSFNIIVAKNI